MEVTKEAKYKILQEVLLPTELIDIPDNICEKLDNFFREKFEGFITAKAVFETNRKNLGNAFI